MSRLLRVTEAASRIGLSERTVRRLIAEHRLSVVRPAGLRAVLIPEESLRMFVGLSEEAEARSPESAVR